jgi:Mesyanzhinovviridae DNA primase
MQIAPKTDLAIDFLRLLRPAGPWVLTAIVPNRGGIETRTFEKSELKEMGSWIDRYQNLRNIYYTLNTVREPVSSKPTKTQILELVALHCDVDPRMGEEFESERKRILSMLQAFEPKASIIIDSGGGYQIVFLLESPVLLDGTVEMAEEYELYNKQLELLLDGDHCFNCDRILRLPGTVNLPDEKKLKKGRLPALASLVSWKNVRYPLAAFAKAPGKIQQGTISGLSGGGEKVQISGNIEPLYVDDLINKNIIIKDDIKQLIVQGKDLDNPTRFPSRSEALWAVVCALVRAGADDETIASLIMTKDNKISESVLGNPRPEKYAAKQIQDAREEADDPILHRMNSKHAVILDHAGTCRVISEQFDPTLSRSRISFAHFNDFKNRYMNIMVQVATDKNSQPVYRSAGEWWLKHPKRRQYEVIVFAPGREVANAYNLWRGFACESLPSGSCELYFEHILQNICNNNQEHYKYLINWLARCVQKPDCPGEVAVVLRGEQGTGKGVFAKIFGSLFGRHFLQVSDSRHLVGNFNSHLRDCCVLLADEAFYAGDKKHESVLKALVTEENLAIESKGVDLVNCSNFTHLIMASNSSWVVPAGSNERRFFVLDVSAGKIQNKKYFAALHNQISAGGRENLLYRLLHHDISSFEVRDVPKTDGLHDQKILSMSSEESWWYEKLIEGRVLKEHDNWEREVMKEYLQNDYIAFMTRMGILRKNSPTVLGKFLGRVCPGGMPKSYQKMTRLKVADNFGQEMMVQRRVYFYTLPELAACRSNWDTHHGGPFHWNPPMEQGEQLKMEDPPEQAFA